MAGKSLVILLTVLLCIILLPIGFGIIGGIFGVIFGLIGGLLGAIFGLIGGLFGAVFGFIGWIFEHLFFWNVDLPVINLNLLTLSLIVLAIWFASKIKSSKT